MTVVTDKRTYMFDLVSGEKSAAPVYALKFSYPNEKPVATGTPPVQQAAAAPVQQTATMTADKLHFDWNTKGNGKLLPSRVFDDGASLYLAWDKEHAAAGDPHFVRGPPGRSDQLPDERRIYRHQPDSDQPGPSLRK